MIKLDVSLNEDNFKQYAISNYFKPYSISEDEFEDDLLRFKYIKRLLNRYLASKHSKNLAERLIINHVIVIFNVFKTEAAFNMLMFKLDDEHLDIIKPFLLHLGYINEYDMIGIPSDIIVVNKIRQLRRTE